MSPQYYLVREDILPGAFLKTLQVKDMLARGEAKTVNEAVAKIGLSRSAYYKYKDGISPLSKLERERIVTLSMDLEHRSGILSKVLATIAKKCGSVLTIHQTIPLQGLASVVLSVESSITDDKFNQLVHVLRSHDGVKRISIIGRG